MIMGILSGESLDKETIDKLIPKKLEVINSIQIGTDKEGNILLMSADFPRSILPALYILSVSDYVIFWIGKTITSFDGEIVLAIENSDVKDGVCLFNEFSDISSFEKLFSNYRVGKFKRIDINGDYEFKPIESQRDFKYISIDKHFLVKGIGSVIIGFVLGKRIEKGDKLFLLPSLKPCSIKSIQIMDIDRSSAERGSYVGLALNNVSEADMSNNYAVSSINEVNDTFTVRFTKSNFYNEDPFSKQLSCSFFGENLSLTLQDLNGEISVKFNKKIPLIRGKYVLADSSLSQGKNRIVGNIEI